MLKQLPLSLAPGQTRPLSFHISLPTLKGRRISLELTYTIKGHPEILRSPPIHSIFSSKNVTEPHRITFLHPSAAVSYAILKAPSTTAVDQPVASRSVPVLLSLHGAGLEADSDEVRHMLDAVSDLPAWVLFPTGMTPWSGDDWRMVFLAPRCWSDTKV